MHFLLLGFAIFVAYSLMPKGSGGEGGKIVITQGQLESMLEGFTRTRQRPANPEEWEGLIRERVREEVYYREALALGLDKDDTHHPPPLCSRRWNSSPMMSSLRRSRLDGN